ncbi:hypothetical protein [Hymenobacter tenuis]
MLLRASLTFMCATLLFAGRGHAQQTKEELKAKLASSVCVSLEKTMAEKPTSLTREQYNKLIGQSFAPALGKDVTAFQRLYGKDAFGNEELMHDLGVEIGAILLQDCPAFMALTSLVSEGPASTASTTGKSTGKLGALKGTGLGMLQLAISKSENAEFAWLSRFQGADELLPKLTTLQGRPVRISWQEVEIFQPEKKQYLKLREITAIELL